MAKVLTREMSVTNPFFIEAFSKRGSVKKEADNPTPRVQPTCSWVEREETTEGSVTFYLPSLHLPYDQKKVMEAQLANILRVSKDMGLVLESLEVGTDIPVIIFHNKNSLQQLKNERFGDKTVLEQSVLLKMHADTTIEEEEKQTEDECTDDGGEEINLDLVHQLGFNIRQVGMRKMVVWQNTARALVTGLRRLYVVQTFHSYDLQTGQSNRDDWRNWSNVGRLLTRLNDKGFLVDRLHSFSGQFGEKIHFMVVVEVYLPLSALISILELVGIFKNQLNGFISVYKQLNINEK